MTTINQLSEADTLANGDQLPIFSEAQGDTRKVNFLTFKESVADEFVSLADLAAQTGAGLVGTADGTDVQQALDARPTSTALALSTGAALVGSNDGAGGTLWTTVAGFITRLLSSAGSAVVGFIQSGTGAVTRTAQAKGRDVLHAADFGVVGDGTTDDTAAMQLAINEAASSGRTLLLPAAIKTGALTVPANTAIQGVGKKTVVTPIAGSYNLFTITGSEVMIENLYIDDAAKTGGWDFVVACGTSTVRRVDIHNVIVLNSYGLLTDSGSGGSGYHIGLKVIDVLTGSQRGPGVQLTRAFAFTYFDRCSIDFVGVSSSNFTAFSFNLSGLGANAGGLTMVDCSVLGTAGTYANTSQHGFSIANTAGVKLVRCQADTVAGKGFIFNTVNAMGTDDIIASLCGLTGIEMTSVTNATFVNTVCGGRNYLGSPGSGDGITLVSGCDTLNFIGGLVADWQRHGFNKSASQAGGIRVTGMEFKRNGMAGVGWGINSIGNSAFSAVSIGFQGNAQGNANLQGTNDYLGIAQLNSGAGNQSAGPGPLTI